MTINHLLVGTQRYVKAPSSNWPEDVWYLQPSLKARRGRIKDSKESAPINGLPATWRAAAGLLYPGFPWKPYIRGCVWCMHPEFHSGEASDWQDAIAGRNDLVEGVCESVYRRNGGYSNGHEWTGDFRIMTLSSESNVHLSATPGALLTKSSGGEKYAAFRALDGRNPPAPPKAVSEIALGLHFVPTSTGDGYCNVFPTPNVNGRLVLPFLGERDASTGLNFPIQWLKLIYDDYAAGEAGNTIIRAPTQICPGVPQRPDVVAGLSWPE